MSVWTLSGPANAKWNLAGKRTAHERSTALVSLPLGAALLSEAAWAEIALSLRLSGRELEISRGVFDNLTEGAIAANLGISEKTIHTHLQRLFTKLRVTTRVQMVVRVMEELLKLTHSEACDLPPICRHRVNGHCPIEEKSR